VATHSSGPRFRRVKSAAAFVALAAVVGLALAGPTPGSRSFADESRPNVLVIESDDQTAQSIRFMANVNALIGDEGATFRNSFVNYSLCCPSRATFLTGQYAHNHGVLSNTAPEGGFSRFQSLHGSNNLAVWLQDSGYYTAMIGKYLNGYFNSPRIPPGWSEWQAAAPDATELYDYTMNENGTLVSYGTDPADYKEDVLTGKAVDLVDRRAPEAQPFFLWLTYSAPHAGGPEPSPQPPSNCQYAPKPAPRHAHAFDAQPLPKPPNFNEADVSDKPQAIRARPPLTSSQITTIQRKYRCELESLLSVDEGVKQVLQALEANGELNSTLIIYTSDNGFFHGEHRVREGKTLTYEESIRVPLMMRGPGVPAGVTIPDLSINADLAPTIVDVAGATPGLEMDGRSLIPVAQKPGIERGRELLIESEADLFDQPPFDAIRTERYVYAEHSTGETELYDIKKDPFELVSRHNDPAYAPIKSRLASHLQKLRNCAGPSCRVRFTP
jgi:N-acetylglucosamine-6-sulfatase